MNRHFTKEDPWCKYVPVKVFNIPSNTGNANKRGTTAKLLEQLELTTMTMPNADEENISYVPGKNVKGYGYSEKLTIFLKI